MHVMVLGVSGFLGSWTARAALAAGHQVTGVSRASSPTWRLDGIADLMLHALPVDRWASQIVLDRPEVVISLDWDGVANQGRADGQRQNSNLERLEQVLEGVANAGVRRFVGSGSQAEYGPARHPIDESTIERPDTAYGRAKLEACRLSREFMTASGTEWVWARVFSVYGPLDRSGTVLETIADRTREGERVHLSSGDQPWSYLYASDAARAMVMVATTPGASGVTLVAHPESPPLRESLSTFAHMLSADAAGLLDFSSGESNSPLQADVAPLMSLGWSPTVASTDGLARTARWLSGDPVDDDLSPGRRLPPRAIARN